MKIDFSGKVVLVTGAAQGIGRVVELIHDVEEGRREQSAETFAELFKALPR